MASARGFRVRRSGQTGNGRSLESYSVAHWRRSRSAAVEFREVSFRIGGALILDNLSFRMEPA